MCTVKQMCIELYLIPLPESYQSEYIIDSLLLTVDSQIELAAKAEEAKLDFVCNLIHYLYKPAGFREFNLDPTLLLTALARETSKIGMVTTVSSLFHPPYILARQLQSLHWISNSRVGWNIVTSINIVFTEKRTKDNI